MPMLNNENTLGPNFNHVKGTNSCGPPHFSKGDYIPVNDAIAKQF